MVTLIYWFKFIINSLFFTNYYLGNNDVKKSEASLSTTTISNLKKIRREIINGNIYWFYFYYL